MEEKYKKAIKTGVVFSLILIAAAVVGNPIVQYLSHTPEYVDYTQRDIDYGSNALGMLPASAWIVLGISALLGLFSLLMYFCCGLLAVRSARAETKDLWDASIVGGIAGVVSVLISTPVTAVYNAVLSVIFGGVTQTGAAAVSFFVSLICCLPVDLVLVVVLAAVGGVVYKVIRPQ